MLITNLVEKSDRILNADEAQRDVHVTTFRVYGSDHFDECMPKIPSFHFFGIWSI